MKKDYLDLVLIAFLLFCLGGFVSSCISMREQKTLEDYRRLVDYMERTNEPFEVVVETDYYTINLQEDRK